MIKHRSQFSRRVRRIRSVSEKGESGVEHNNFLLKVKNLRTYFYLDDGVLKAVDGVSFKIEKEKVLGLVRESGCGKSVTAQSILRIVPPPGKVEGEILLRQKSGNAKKGPLDLVGLNPKGKKIRSIQLQTFAEIDDFL